MTAQPVRTTSAIKALMIKVGDFFFKWRNQAFPLFLLLIFIAVPPSNTFLGREGLEWIREVLALGLVLAGLVLRGTVVGYAYIKRGGVGKKVYAADLVTTGLFGACRNPLYVGNLLIVAGILAMHGDPRVFIGGAVLMGFIYQSIVYAEERFLEGKFGEGYLAYCADVPRWGFRLSRLPASTEGMRFNLVKALLAEYTTIATSLTILAITKIYEQLAHPDDTHAVPVWVLVAGIGVALVWTIAFRVYKKRIAGKPGWGKRNPT